MGSKRMRWFRRRKQQQPQQHSHFPSQWMGDIFEFGSDPPHISVWRCECGEMWGRAEGIPDHMSSLAYSFNNRNQR